MNSKAIKRQLLAAIAMVLVAAIALGSSTYAWFVASGTVTADGMKVQAQSEGGLAIREASELANWGTTASVTMVSKKLRPTSTYDMTRWSYAKAADYNNYAAVENTRENVTSSVLSSNGAFVENNYVVMKAFQIRSTSKTEPAQGLYVSEVKVTTDDSETVKSLSTALRVGVRYVPTTGGAVTYIYGPVTANDGTDEKNNPTQSYTWHAGVGDTTDPKAQSVKLSTVGKGTSDIVASTVEIPEDAGKALKVEIYIWFEGEDKNLFSGNYSAQNLNVSVSFASMTFKGATTVGG